MMMNSDDQLLSECDVQTFRSSGKGGQHVNTTDSAVRLIHRPSGIVVKASQERSQYLNKRIALAKLKMKLAESKKVKKKRIPTKPSKAAQERRLKEKKRRSEVKKMRRVVD